MPKESTKAKRPLGQRMAFSLVANFFLYCALLFGGAGTLKWAHGWLVILLVTVAYSATFIWLFRNNKPLLEERLGRYWQKDQPTIDKLLLFCFMATYAAAHAFCAYDVFHLQLLPEPHQVWRYCGFFGAALGWRIVFLSLRDNTFAAPVVKHQVSREHHVVDRGVYQIVRHPMYAGFVPIAIGTALWLGSSAGALAMLVPIIILVGRVVVEERFLRSHLEGYETYTQNVRFRLVPYIW